MLRLRVLTAAVLIAVLLAALFWLPRTGWWLFSAAVIGLCAREWGGLVAPAMRSLYALLLLALAAGSLWLVTLHPGTGRIWYWGAACYWVLAAPLWIARRPAGAAWPRLLAGVFVLVPAFLAIVELRASGPGTLLGLLGLVWISDTAAYFIGSRFGRHKLAPAISPGKTWEGVAGALLASALYASVWAASGAPLPAPGGAFVALLLVLAVIGILGDLVESQLKRVAGVKDSGDLLPGHGGMLDRLDALIAVLPFAALVFLA